jgi:hypothetical protein
MLTQGSDYTSFFKPLVFAIVRLLRDDISGQRFEIKIDKRDSRRFLF